MAIRYYDSERDSAPGGPEPRARDGFVAISSPTYAQPICGTWLTPCAARVLYHWNGQRDVVCTLTLGRCFLCESHVQQRVCWWGAALVGTRHTTRAVKLTAAAVRHVQPYRPGEFLHQLRGRDFTLYRVAPSAQAGLRLVLAEQAEGAELLPPGPDMAEWCGRFYRLTVAPPAPPAAQADGAS